MPQKKPFVLAPHRPMAAKPTPPSPFRLIVIPKDGPQRIIECRRSVQAEYQARNMAKQYAADCGLAGHVEVQESVSGAWVLRRIMDVKNSAVAGWRSP